MIDTEPDYRFTLANERTFLAWIRTALALLAGSVTVGHLITIPDEESWQQLTGAICAIAAAAIALGAFGRWNRIQAAMRREDPLPGSPMMSLIVSGVCLASVACIDRGLQAERTTLAWRRTMLTSTCVALICARATAQTATPFLFVTTLALGLSVVATAPGTLVRHHRYRMDPLDARTHIRGLLLVTSATVASAAAISLPTFFR